MTGGHGVVRPHVPSILSDSPVRTRAPRFPREVDDVTVRLIAGVVLVLAVVALATRQPWLYGVLAVDFVLRAGFGPRRSPIARFVLRLVRPRVAAAPRTTAGVPKRFAATIGAVLTVVAFAAAYGPGWTTLTWAVGAVMVVFPALESLLGICVGCLAFRGLMRIGVVPASICAECADVTRRQRTNAAEPSTA
jgi:hypothetical protein